MRLPLLIVALIAAVLAGVATASAVLPTRSADATAGPDAVTPDDDAPRTLARTQDPRGGPDWAVRVYRSRTGATCPELGRTDGRQFGARSGEGVTPVPLAAAGSCGDLGASPAVGAVNIYPDADAKGGYVIAAFGVLSDPSMAVALRLADGTEQPATRDGSAYTAITDSEQARGARLLIRGSDGQIARGIPLPTGPEPPDQSPEGEASPAR